VKANMRQKRYRRKTEREDDGLPPPTAPKQQYSTDLIIVSKSSSDQKKLSSDGEVATHTVRDTYSGILYAIALTDSSFDPEATEELQIRHWPSSS